MIHCRANGIDSDVYVYGGAEAGMWLVCSGCLLIQDGRGEFNTVVRQSMLDHLAQHLAAGHKVPEWAIARLTKEMEEHGDLNNPVGDRPGAY